MSYVTGAHNLKSGFTIIRGNVTGNTINRADDVGGLPISYTFTNGVPTSMTLFASRNSDAHLDHDLALFVQDQWALRRLTLSLGLRLDWMSQSLGAVDNPANALFPAYSSPARDGVPNWKDLSPRHRSGLRSVRRRQDGDSRAASTGTWLEDRPVWPRSSARRPTSARRATGQTPTPTSIPIATSRTRPRRTCVRAAETCAAPTTTRAWRPSRENTTVANPDFTNGWFKRGYNWRASAGIEQQLTNRLAVSATYARTIYGNFSVTDNLNLTPADFDPYCITLPADSRLPRSGQQLCGLWDQRTNVATSNLVGVRR